MNRLKASGIVIIILAGIGTYLFSTPDPLPQKASLRQGPIVAFGDSLIAGHGATFKKDLVNQLEDRINRDIVNLGVNGDTTAKALERVSAVTDKDPSVVIVLLGGNDYLRKVPIDETFSNLGKIVDAIHVDGGRVLLLGVRGGLLRDIFEERFEEFAESKDVEFVPNVLDGLIGKKEYMSDAIHPNNAGYAIIADRVEPVLRRMLED